MATSQGIITQVFPDHERGRALGISGASVALGIVLLFGSLIFGQNFGFTHLLILLGFIISGISNIVFILIAIHCMIWDKKS